MAKQAEACGRKILRAWWRVKSARAIAKKTEETEEDRTTRTAVWSLCQMCSRNSDWDVYQGRAKDSTQFM